MDWILNSFNGYGGFVWGAFSLTASLLLGYFGHSWLGYQQAKSNVRNHQALDQAFETDLTS